MWATRIAVAALCLSACAPLGRIGQPPEMSPPVTTVEHTAMMTPAFPFAEETEPYHPAQTASLWTGERGSLLGERRAMTRGDILTVVVEIDEGAQINNSSDRSRRASQEMEINDLFGWPQRMDERLPAGASMGSAVGLGSNSSARGDGSIRRSEKLTLRVAATVTDVMPNGVLAIQGSQEVRVNFEMRELLVSGFVRPIDISRQNEITYDKIASARISYGGEGQISDMQQPRYGQQIADALLPF